MNDWQLLQEYAARGSEAAFRTLTERHINLVYSAAVRQVQDAQLAEEVCQSVFILLARKARHLRPGTSVTGWLYRTTRFVATRARRTEIRRQRRQQEAFEMQQLEIPDQVWSRVAPELDEALAQLQERDRKALLLRFFEDKSFKETGAALAVNEDAARKRVERALEKLRHLLVDRGCAISAAGLAGALAANSVKAAPAGLAGSVAACACASAKVCPAALPALTREVLSSWRWARIWLTGILAGAGAGIILLFGLLKPPGVLGPRNPAQPAAIPVATTRANASRVALNVAGARAPKPAESVLRLRVLAKGTGGLVGDAQLAMNTVVKENWQQRYDLATDPTGIAEVPYPPGATRLDIGVLASGWGVRQATWVPANQDPIPAEYTLWVEPVTNTMGGWLRDAHGEPVAQAEVVLSFPGPGDFVGREMPRECFGLTGVIQPVVAKSDSQGWWTCAVIPRANHGPFRLTARHPEFQPAQIVYAAPHSTPEDTESPSVQLLWAARIVTRMEPGLTVAGRVVDESGRPVANALISHEPYSTEALSVPTDASGRFSFTGLGAGDFDFVISAPGFAPEYRQVGVQQEIEPVAIKLRPGALLRLRLVDPQGEPVPGAKVGLEQWGEHRQKLKWAGESDADGRVNWTSAPPEQELELYAFKDGWCYSRDLRFKADGEEHAIKMQRVLELSGWVTDAVTGQPVQDLKAFPCYGEGKEGWQRSATHRGIGGKFLVRFEERSSPWRVRVEAEGYVPFDSKPVPSDFAGMLKVALQPLPTATPPGH